MARRDSAVQGIPTAAINPPAESNEPLPDPTSVSSPPVEIIKPRSQASRQPLTQAALAKRLGVNSSRISRMQLQANFPQWSSIAVIARFFILQAVVS